MTEQTGRPAPMRAKRAAHGRRRTSYAPNRHAKARAAQRAPGRRRLLGRRWVVDMHTREIVTTLPTWRLR